MTLSWSADEYARFERERTRPVRDLLAAVSRETAARVVDVGCGPGNSTRELINRFPTADVYAFDSAEAMCREARRRLPGVRIDRRSVESWLADPSPPAWMPDVILSNAVLQWVPDHARLLPALVGRLSEGGTLAIQMPDNLQEPTHVLMEKVGAHTRWAERLACARDARTRIQSPDWYATLLRPLCLSTDIWRTTYYHPLAGGVAAIVDWMKGTGLKPFLDPLAVSEREAFCDEYARELEAVFQPGGDGSVLLPFPRLFLVANAR